MEPRRSPVHLRQQLVDGLPGVGVHGGLYPLSPHAVQLVDEHHAGGVGLGLSWGKGVGDSRVKGGVGGEGRSNYRPRPQSVPGDSLKRFRIRLAPTPTNISSNSEPEA